MKTTICLIALLMTSTWALSAACSRNTIRIEGVGNVESVPDFATLSVKATGRGPTASEALSNLNKKVD